MTLIQTVILGVVAGFTIYLGLPVGRIRGLSEKTRSFLLNDLDWHFAFLILRHFCSYFGTN